MEMKPAAYAVSHLFPEYSVSVCQPPGGNDVERILMLREGLIKYSVLNNEVVNFQTLWSVI